MTMLNDKLSAIVKQAISWRHDIHSHPELAYKEIRTSRFVAEKLREFGVDHIEEGIACTGVLATIKGKASASGPRIGLRADLDALPIKEISDKPYRSKIDGCMHACGHDGHIAMLLAAAQYLASTRNFNGTAVLIFQPAEEGAMGAERMVEAGIFDRYPIDEIYGLHNWPGLPIGKVAIRPGPVMPTFDVFRVSIEGVGAHAAKPQNAIDPLVIGCHIVTALQTIVSRNIDPLEMACVSVCAFHCGEASNVISPTAEIIGSARAYSKKVQDTIASRTEELCVGIGKAFGAKVSVDYTRTLPAVVNDAAAVQTAQAAVQQAGLDLVTDWPPSTAGEDFSFFLEKVRGAFIFVGNGDSEVLHNPSYDFSDDCFIYGMRTLISLVECR
jgi:hippurate hydrolase